MDVDEKINKILNILEDIVNGEAETSHGCELLREAIDAIRYCDKPDY